MATAYAALLSLSNNLDIIQNHPRHSFSFENKQIKSLCESVRFLIDYMKSYDKEAVEALERRIAFAAHAAEDVIESHVVDQIRGGSTLAGKTTSRFLLDLQKVIEDMDFVRRKASQVVEVTSAAATSSIPSAATTLPTTLTSQKNTMVGFDDVLNQLINQLTGMVPSSRQVIPIVGMGGIGKTTLARNAFEHSYTMYHFDVRLWTTISQQFSVQKILTELLSGLSQSTSRIVGDLGHELYKNLCGRRYLIVLDDMWSVEAWEEIKFFFPDIDNIGSRIVVTSRHSGVADHLSSLYRLDMSFLDEHNSWDLFCRKAFAEQVCPPELEEIGKKIVQKCKGLPLAIVVVGGYLQKSSRTLEYWENVANQMNSILNSAENERCLNLLCLSYSYLPIYLKPCFLFMGVFSEDEEISELDILKPWIAEGFIEPSEGRSLEDVAKAYLQDLIERNLIIVCEWRFQGQDLTCKIHDLVRELCLKIGEKDEFFHVLDTPRAIYRERRVVVNGKVEGKMFDAPTSSAPLVRSLICEGGRLSDDLKLLRILTKVDKALANDVNFQQLNLRYLKVDLDYTSHRSIYLPSSISLLWSLQTLIITGDYPAMIAPYEVWEMPQLRHLIVDSISLVDPLPTGSSDQENYLVLRNLQTLSRLENFRLSEEVCKRIPNIKELRLSYSDFGRDFDEASSYYCPRNLGCFNELEYLACRFDRDSKWRDFALSLTFPSSLKRLSLTGSRLDWEELTMMVGSLPHLEILQLYSNSVVGSVWTPVEGKFLRLKYLSINNFGDFIHWDADSSHFPVLEKLHLRFLSKMDEFPSGIGEIPTLQSIYLDFCSSFSLAISAMKILTEQQDQGNEYLQLRVTVRGDDETLERFNKMVQEDGLITKNLFIYLQRVKTGGVLFMIIIWFLHQQIKVFAPFFCPFFFLSKVIRSRC